MSVQLIAHDRLREVLHYDPAIGVFTWKVKPNDRIMEGAVAGYVSAGYRYVKIDYRSYLMHRLAFFYMTGEWPEHEIDHRDLDKLNNSWANLRPATRKQNASNLGHRAGRALPKGVYFDRGKFVANIRHNNQSIYLGRFVCSEEAHRVYMTAARDLHGEFARAG